MSNGGVEDEQNKVAEDEVGSPQPKFDDLDDELTSRLRHSMGAEANAPPFPSPPSSVRLVMLKLTRQEEGYDDFMDCSLNENNSDQSNDRMGYFPTLKEPLFPTFSKMLK